MADQLQEGDTTDEDVDIIDVVPNATGVIMLQEPAQDPFDDEDEEPAVEAADPFGFAPDDSKDEGADPFGLSPDDAKDDAQSADFFGEEEAETLANHHHRWDVIDNKACYPDESSLHEVSSAIEL